MSAILYLCPTRDKSGPWGDPTGCAARLYDEDHEGGTKIRCAAHGEVFEKAPPTDVIPQEPLIPEAKLPPMSGPNAPKPEDGVDLERLRKEYENLTGFPADRRWKAPRLLAEVESAREQVAVEQNNPRSGAQADPDFTESGPSDEDEGDLVEPEPEAESK